MGLTLTEKEHWKDRIAVRIEKKIEALISTKDPNFLTDIREKAEEMAYGSLGVAEEKERLDEIKEEKEKLEEEEEALKDKMYEKVTGKDASRRSRYSRYGPVKEMVKSRRTVHEEMLMEDSELGRKILALKREKSNLIDTVWLATTVKQVKELWKEVSDLLESGDGTFRAREESS